jgi:hypothetical protein
MLMKESKNTCYYIVLISFLLCYGSFCSPKKSSMTDAQQIQQEQLIIDSLLRDEAFTEDMAKALDSAYYQGIGETAPEFLKAEEQTSFVDKSYMEEKTATNLAGFYALECGVELLCDQTGETPVAWLERVSSGSADSSAVLLLNRFANATWKAGQPFRGLERIKRPNFRVANFLSKEEIDKDYVQIKSAATKLLSSMQPVKGNSLEQQMERLRSLLQDTAYAVEMASYMDSSYAVSQNQKATPVISAAEEGNTVKKSVREMKIATNVAGFYAMECALNYLVTRKNVLPSVVLKSLVNDTISKEDKMIFARFANATWKAGQPFRGLDRIHRPTFTPFYFLSEEDVEKDVVQVRTAAGRVLAVLQKIITTQIRVL